MTKWRTQVRAWNSRKNWTRLTRKIEKVGDIRHNSTRITGWDEPASEMGLVPDAGVGPLDFLETARNAAAHHTHQPREHHH